MTAAAAVEPTELEELMKAQAEAAHEREVGDATRPTAEDLAASPTRIDVEGLDLFYGDHHALKDVNIKIRDKQITSFIGPSGCGKSTLLRCFNRMNDGIKDCRIEGDAQVTAVVCDGERAAVDGVFLLRPTVAPTDLFPGLAVENGYVSVDRRMNTNLPGLFAAGDCTGGPLQVSKAVGEGLIAGQSAAAWAVAQSRT